VPFGNSGGSGNLNIVKSTILLDQISVLLDKQSLDCIDKLPQLKQQLNGHCPLEFEILQNGIDTFNFKKARNGLTALSHSLVELATSDDILKTSDSLDLK
jgi:hypothetical protein